MNFNCGKRLYGEYCIRKEKSGGRGNVVVSRIVELK
jgi:hypothetical protein